ncbi:MAG: hypothetical protein ACOC3V_05665 [bacterium]
MLFSEWKKINEARRNPEKNPKISAYEKLKPYFNNENIYISFTSIDKLGIKPKSEFNTPLGIYCYPLKQIKEFYDETNEDWNKNKEILVPFAGDRDFIWVFKPKNPEKIMELSKYNSLDWDRDIKIIKRIAKKYGVLDDIIAEIPDIKYKAKVRNPGGYFWYITMALSNYIKGEYRNKKLIVIWNTIFRELGYDGITDKKGQGIIHSAEPIQAIFFSKNAIETIEKVINKSYIKKTVEYIISGKVYSFYPHATSGINYPLISYSVNGEVFENGFNKAYQFIRININKLKNNKISLTEFENNIKELYNKVYGCKNVEIDMNIEFQNIERSLKKSGIKFLDYLFEQLSTKNFREIITDYSLYEIDTFLNEVEKIIIRMYGEESEEFKYFTERKKEI